MRQESSDPPKASTESAGGRRRGRPSVIDTEAIAEAAFRLWSRQGYADTSWNDLAEATGISARTLIRHFSVKSAIAWIGVAPATERLRASLSVAPETAPLTDAVRTAIVESISHRPHIQRVGRDWLRLIAGTPELAAMSSEAYRPWITELADYIGRRVPEVPAAIARALATAYQAAAFAALTEWAEEGAHGDPADAVDAMLRWMDIVPRSSARPA
ncbi:TetR/AcrR family transcriptional regulator [Rhodococcus rhodochrous]|uniref:TetR/AcrR family transcriptional regulator n=1 Tax=Rhodococcus rhodochrous TaxID=1829 RepID=UPI00132ED25D|nr:TetR/AcrR family transcriptional regulator [Rhodococcus rhodochrous]QHG82302.1 TetR family transcriptional regulator [Rhodococcus rhodochrous]QOH58018.1 TetR family transcriptional regulator [Rhodococcus rhodochrous]